MTEYDLPESVKSLGRLNPILKDKFGNIIDGFHRFGIDPTWPTLTLDFIDTPQKLEAARLATNTNRRTVTPEEMTTRIGLLAKSGLKAEEIAQMTGLGASTVYKYYPQELKVPEKVLAGAVGGSALRVEHTVTIQDAVKCDRCHISTFNPVEWNNHQLCQSCHDKALADPDRFNSYFNLQKAQPKTVLTTDTPRSLDSWEHRKAQMSPQKSALELSVIQDLQREGLAIETDREFCTQKTVPDGFIQETNIAIFIDGPVHRGKEDRDEKLRERFQKLHGCHVVTVQFDKDTKQERERVKMEIREGLKWQ